MTACCAELASGERADVESLLAKGSFRKWSTEKVGMNVEDGLPGERAGIENEAELSTAVIVGELLHDRYKLGEQRRVCRGQLRHVGELLRLRHHEQVNGSLWRDVPERDDALVFEDDIRGYLARDYAREKGGFRCYRHASRVRDAADPRPELAGNTATAPCGALLVLRF